MKFNTKILYALMAAGLMMPMTNIQAWTWKWGSAGAAPLLKVQEKAQEEVKKEAAKNSSVVADLAWKGTKAVAKATAQTAWFTTKETAKFAYNNPRTAATLAGAGYLYYKRGDIANWFTKKYEQAKTVVGTVAPVATAALLGRLAYDVLAPSSQAAIAAQPAVAPAQLAAKDEAQQAVKPGKTSEELEKERLEMDALVDEYLAYENGEKETAKIEQEEKQKAAMEEAWNQAQPQVVVVDQAAQEADRIKRAQERLQNLRFEAAWKDAQSQPVVAPVDVMQIDAEMQKAAQALNQPEQGHQLTDILNPEEVQRNAQAFLSPEPVITPIEFPVVIEKEVEAPSLQPAQDNWVEEFRQLKENKWAREYLEKRAEEEKQKAIEVNKNNVTVMDRIRKLVNHLGFSLVPSAHQNAAEREEHARANINDFRNLANISNPCEAPAPLLNQ